MTINFAVVFLVGWLLYVYAGGPVPSNDGLNMLILGTLIWSAGYTYFWICRRYPMVGVVMLGFLSGLLGGRRRW